jgi:TRAP transporter TAXI family solute receptor
VSGIKKASDMKGKRAAYVIGSPTLRAQMLAHLAFAGLTWNDVIKVEFPSYVSAIRGLMEGTTDMASVATTTPVCYEVESSPMGISYVPLPAGDKEGWARLKKIAPYYIPVTVTRGAALSKDRPLETATYPYPAFTVYPSMSEDVAYFITKAIIETLPVTSPMYKDIESYFQVETNFKMHLGGIIPFHQGSIRYFKERGWWTGEYEKINQKALNHQKRLKFLWDKAVAEWSKKKAPSKDFSKFWMDNRKKLNEL